MRLGVRLIVLPLAFVMLSGGRDDIFPAEEPIIVPDVSAANVAASDRFYFFHRENTDFHTALADLRECHAFAEPVVRLLEDRDPYATPWLPPQSPLDRGSDYAGEALGAYLSNKVIGGDNRRAQQRAIVRRCMYFKAYGRFATTETLWRQFNTEEGNRPIAADDLNHTLLQQAKIASGAKPLQPDMGE